MPQSPEALKASSSSHGSRLSRSRALASCAKVPARARAKAKADAYGGRAERAAFIAAEGMRLAGVREVRGKVYRFAMQKVGGKLALEVDKDALPVAWRLPVPEPGEMPPDNDRIRAELERDGAVPGCALRPRGERVVLK